MTVLVAWADLEARARALLDQARVVLEGPATNYEGSSSRGVPDSKAPVATGRPTLELMAQTLHEAAEGEELLRAIHWAEVQLYRVRYSRKVGRVDSAEKLRGRVLREWTGSAPEEVAAFETVTVAQVTQWRAHVGKDPLTGRAAEAPRDISWQTPEERALRIQQLKAAHPHLSARALAMMTGTSHVTVLADLRRGPYSPIQDG